MRLFAMISMIVALTTGAASAMDKKAFDAGLNVGEMVPTSFSVVDGEGNTRDFASLSGEKGVAIFFVRSLDWCPYCKKQVINADKHAAEIEQLGYTPITVSYDKLKHLAKFDKKKNIAMEMYSDPNSAVIDAFKLRNEKYGPKHYAHGVPHPAIYVISKDGLIQAKLLEEGYKVRPGAEDVIAAIKELQLGS